jgi:hypothetical protein
LCATNQQEKYITPTSKNANDCYNKGEKMSKSEGNIQQQLSALIKKTVDEIEDDYHFRFWEILDKLGLLSEGCGGDPVPLEVWTGIAQALADASGYHFILQAEILEPIKDSPGMYRSVGRREISNIEPMVWVHE